MSTSAAEATNWDRFVVALAGYMADAAPDLVLSGRGLMQADAGDKHLLVGELAHGRLDQRGARGTQRGSAPRRRRTFRRSSRVAAGRRRQKAREARGVTHKMTG